MILVAEKTNPASWHKAVVGDLCLSQLEREIHGFLRAQYKVRRITSSCPIVRTRGVTGADGTEFAALYKEVSEGFVTYAERHG
jgi:hypothetical protein